MSYEAIVTQLKNVRTIKGADRIKLANCLGYQVIVGADAKDDDVMVLFPDDGQLSEAYAQANDLVAVYDEFGKKISGGFFSANRRIKAQKMRGEKSEAYVASMDSFKFTGVDITTLVLGTRFSELNGIPICNKYYTPATLRAAKNGTQKSDAGELKARLKKLFPEHQDTEQLRFAQDHELEGLVTLTRKLHGTSARTGWVQVPFKKEPTLWQQIKEFVFEKDYREEVVDYKMVYGTRRVFKGEIAPNSTDYRQVCANILAPYIQKGEVWYYEIVGFEDTGAPIMQPVSTSEMPKDFQKRFGETITYKYGCLPGTYDIYVYRITARNADGVEIELPWNTVKDKCNRAGVKHVPEIYQYLVRNADDVAKLKATIEYYTEEVDVADPIDESHPHEGVCIRVDPFTGNQVLIFKNKTFVFKVLEGICKSEDTVDAEELEALGE